MWRGKPERVPWCSLVHHSKLLIGLNPCVIHLHGFLHLIQALGPLIGLFHSFIMMVHWYLSLSLGNLYLQYQNFPISIHFFFVFYLKNIKIKIKNTNTAPSTLLQRRGCRFRLLGHFFLALWVSFWPPWTSFSVACTLIGRL